MLNSVLIRHADIVSEGSVLENHSLLLRDGEIAQIREDGFIDVSNISKCETIEAGGNYISSGFIDLHIHGIHNYLVNQGRGALERICAILPQYGVTGFLPTMTPLPPGGDERLLKELASSGCSGAEVLGFHLEGPFLSLTGALSEDAVGAHDPSQVEILINSAEPYKAIFSISPEIDGALELIHAMTKGGQPAFITHTRADVHQTIEAIAAGARHATHFYDVFESPSVKEAGVRQCGAVEAILADPSVSVDFILDGVHVDPVAVKMALRCKPIDKVCLITDANIGAGLGPGIYDFDGRKIEVDFHGAPARLVCGRCLAGSGLTMNVAVKNAVEMLGISLPAAVEMATASPAAVLGLQRIGLIKEGFRADIVMFDSDFNIIETWVNGVSVFNCRRC